MAYSDDELSSDEVSHTGSDSKDFVVKATSKIQLFYSYYNSPIATGRVMRTFLYQEQWDQTVRNARTQKATLQFNVLQPYARAIIGEYRASDPQWELMPKNSLVPQQVVDIREGLNRQILYASNSKMVFQAMVKDGIDIGYGALNICVDYENSHTMDQVIRLEHIQDVFTCAWDPGATHPNKIDGEWCNQQLTMSKEEFKRRWPEADLAAATPFSFQGLQAQIYFADEDLAFVQLYSYRKYYNKTILQLDNGQSMEKEEFEEHCKNLRRKRKRLLKMRAELPGDIFEELFEKTEIPKIVDKRKSTCSKVMQCLMTQAQVLEETEFPSAELSEIGGQPALPLIYYDAFSVMLDGKQTPIPLFQTAVDAQRAVNYINSTICDAILCSRKEQWLVTPAMVEGHEDWWSNPAAVQGGLYYNPGPNGERPIPNESPPFNPLLLHAVETNLNLIKGVVGKYNEGAAPNSQEAFNTVLQRQTQSNLPVAVYLDNATDAITVTGRVVNSLISKVYDNERTITIIDKNGQPKTINLNKQTRRAFEKDGDIQYEVENDMSIGEYDIRVTAGGNFAVEKQQNFQQTMQFMEAADSPAFSTYGDLLASQLNVSNAPQITKRTREFVVNPAIVAAEEHKPPPPPPPPTPQEKLAKAQEVVDALKIVKEIKQMQLDSKEADLKFKESIIKAISDIRQNQLKTAAAEFNAVGESVKAIGGETVAQIEATGRVVDTFMKTENTKLKKENEFMHEILEDLSGA